MGIPVYVVAINCASSFAVFKYCDIAISIYVAAIQCTGIFAVFLTVCLTLAEIKKK